MAASARTGDLRVLSIKLFGNIAITKDGQSLALPPSRKTRALLGLLLLSGKPLRREHLCSILWDLPDDPRGALRWSLSKLKMLLQDGEKSAIVADRSSVAIDASVLRTDLSDLRDLAEDAAGRSGEAEAIWQATSEPLLADCELPNQSEFAVWLATQRAETSSLRAPLATRMASLLQDDDAQAQLWQARAAEEMQHIAADPGAAVTPTDQRTELPRQTIRFVRASDGTSLAWASVGSEDAPPLVKTANWLNHLELDWDAPIWSPLFRELSASNRLLRYDERGCGLSDWNVPSIDFESFVTDLELVVDAAGLERFPLLGISQGAAVSIEYAARHPDRVSKLILFGGYPVGWRPVASELEVREREAVMTLTETGWGRDNPVYRHMFSGTFMPGASAEELAWFDEFQRQTTSPANAVRFLEAFSNIDVRHRLAELKVPTLVVHSLHEKRIPVTTGRSLAAQIPDAEFLGLDSPNHLLLGREPAARVMLDAIRNFLKS